MKSVITGLFFLVLFAAGCSDGSPSKHSPPTLLGLHGTLSLAIADEFSAQLVRSGFTDVEIALGKADPLLFQNTLDKLIALHASGRKIVLFLTWPKVLDPNFERIPVGADRTLVFTNLTWFLEQVGESIDWVQISQEPFGATPYDDNEYDIDDIVLWWEAVALHIRSVIALNPQLSHLKITTGAITAIREQLDPPTNPIIVDAIDKVILFGETFCDAIDMHVHTTSYDTGIREIEYVKSRTTMPLTCTEWSEGHAIDTWIDELSTIYTLITNRTVINNAYDPPGTNLSLADWYDFIATAPYTPQFIPKFYDVFNSNKFVFACYAGVFQYGNAKHDCKMLKAKKTTDDPLAHNEPFYSDYINLAESLE